MSNDLLLLSCSHHSTMEPSLFLVFDGDKPCAPTHDLLSDPPSRWKVNAVSIDEGSILVPKDYGWTVADWVDRKIPNSWKVYDPFYSDPRPSEFTMCLVKAMIQEVFRWHDEGKCHGMLDSLEHYGFSETPLPRLLGDNPIRVTLLPRLECERASSDVGVDKDGLFLDSAFHKIFGTQYPGYLKHWGSLISSSNWLKNKWLIANHPAFWTWMKRRNFVEEVWEKYEMGGDVIAAQIERAMTHVHGWRNWMSKLRAGSPMHKVMSGNNLKQDIAIEFLRFVRLVLHHMKDSFADGSYRYIDYPSEERYLNSQFVEKEVTNTYPSFLVDLCIGLRKEGVIIRPY